MAILIPFYLNPSNSIKNIEIELKFKGENAYLYVKDQIEINQTHFRIPGTRGREDCAKYFVEKFREIDPEFNFLLHNFSIQSVMCQNVLFKLNEKKTNIVILGAHYDSRAKATKDNSNPESPVPGANDGASSCGVLIELASILYQRRENLSCQIWFLFFDAEDQGYDYGPGLEGWNWCEGSTQFVKEIESFYDTNIEFFDSMILLDMVGSPNLRFIREQYSTPSLLDEIFEVGRLLGYEYEFPINPDSFSIIDDHKAFLDIGIPSADLIINFWNNPDWPYHHAIQDDLSHITITSMMITGRTVEQYIYNKYLIILN